MLMSRGDNDSYDSMGFVWEYIIYKVVCLVHILKKE